MSDPATHDLRSITTTEAAALAYGGLGWRVVPLHSPTPSGCSCGDPGCSAQGKHPRIAGWADDASADPERIKEWWDVWPTANVGVAFGSASGLIDLETDPRNGGTQSLASLEHILGALPPTLSFRSGGGGIHRLFKYPTGFTIRKQTHIGKDLLARVGVGAGKTGVDLMSDGAQAAMPPSVHASGRRYQWLTFSVPADLPPAWAAYLSTGRHATQTEEERINDLLEGSKDDVLADITLDFAAGILEHLDPSCDRDTWIRVGQAFKIQFTADQDEEAYAIWDKWSARSPEQYPGPEQTRYQWDHLGKRQQDGRNKVTFRTVIRLAKEAGWRPSASDQPRQPPKGLDLGQAPDERERLRREDETLGKDLSAKIQAATSVADLQEVANEINKLELFEHTRKQLVDDYAKAYEGITNKRISKTAVRELLSDDGQREERAREMAEEQGWYNDYAYASEGRSGMFLNMRTMGAVTPACFDSLYASQLVTPIRRAQGIIAPLYPPSDLVLNCDLIPKVSGIRYAPGEAPIFEEDGQTWVNRYRAPTDGEEDPMMFEPEQAAAVAKVDQHLTWMLGPQRAALLRQYLTFIYRNPGDRVRWCYLIIGPKGIGKSFIASLARSVLGHLNVKDVGPSTLSHTSFNAWVEGAQLNVIEELKVDGARRAEIMNSLKAAITNDVVDVHRKGIDPYQAKNTASLIAFTNYHTAVAVSEDDRRYFICRTKFHTRSDFLKDLGGAEQAMRYFKDLFKAAKDHGPAMRGWLAATDLRGFDPSQALDSDEKGSLAEVSGSELEPVIHELIEKGHQRIRRQALEVAALREEMAMRPETRAISVQHLIRVLMEMGYERASKGPIDPLRLGDPQRWMVLPSAMEGAVNRSDRIRKILSDGTV